MRSKVVGVFLVISGIVNAAPSPAAISPIRTAVDCTDDDISGSGLEANRQALQRPNKRATLRLRVPKDEDRVALLRLLTAVPGMVGESFPESRRDQGLVSLMLPLMAALFAGESLSLDEVVAKSALPADFVRHQLDRLASRGLVILAIAPDQGTRVAPTAAMLERSREFVDRLYYALSLNGDPR
jgi:hypothetical protein